MSYKNMTRLFGTVLAAVLALAPLSARSGELVTYILTDHLGTPSIEMNGAGQVIKREVYGPYGQAQISPNESGIGYTGHRQDGDTGLTYMQARYFDPAVKRFLSADPVGFDPNRPMTFNRYSYANNNPYKFVDPDGEDVVYVATRIASKEEIKEVASSLKNNSEVDNKFIGQIESSSNIWVIRGGTKTLTSVNNSAAATSGKGTGGTITVNMTGRADVVTTTAGDQELQPEEALLHEIVHGADADKGNLDHSINPATGNPVKEDRAMKVENEYRDEQGLPGHREEYPSE